MEEKVQKKTQNKVTEEVAEKEFKKWLTEVRRIKESTIEDKNPDTMESVTNCINMIIDGSLSIGSDEKITYKLAFPIGEEFDSPIEEITFATRLKANAFDSSRKYKNADDSTRTKIIISQLTGLSMAFVNKMEMSDITTVSDLIYFYFLV